MIQCISTSNLATVQVQDWDTGHMCVYTFPSIHWTEKRIENMWPEINSIENKSLPVLLLYMAGGWPKRNRLESELMTINRRMNKLVQNSWLHSMDRWMNVWSTDVCHVMLPWWNSNENGRMYCLYQWVGGGWKGFSSKQPWNNTTTINWRCVKVYCVPIQLI